MGAGNGKGQVYGEILFRVFKKYKPFYSFASEKYMEAHGTTTQMEKRP